MQYIELTNTNGNHAPAGGAMVSDRLSGEEKFYKGGQFLPQTKLSSKGKKSSQNLKWIIKKNTGNKVFSIVALKIEVNYDCAGYFEVQVEDGFNLYIKYLDDDGDELTYKMHNRNKSRLEQYVQGLDHLIAG